MNLITRMGTSHHFLRSRMNTQSSLAKLTLLIGAPLPKTAVVGRCVVFCWSPSSPQAAP